MESVVNALPLFLLVFMRATSFFITAPIFSTRSVPNRFKVGLGFFIALIVTAGLGAETDLALDLMFVIYILKELFIGLALGFIASLILYTVQVAGAFIDFQMGFVIANVIDPQTRTQVPIIGNFKYMLALLFLVSVDGHHMMLDGLVRSYELLPANALLSQADSQSLARFIAEVFAGMFFSAFQLALPIVASLFLVDVALGLLARAVPQVNIFVVGLPLKIFVGFVLILVTIPTFFFLLRGVFQEMLDTMGRLIQLLGG
ncbi:flagellar biosynthetic protein FliR [Pseudalkalibacillus hwajinpoensis]|uniref:flagellar biosynthetic protein FliR n=1 Tax=Guptibacillus hwajinpoensis TaxID=208199 RepID=UPI001CD69B33|nr:flagellar biosynthetic protein FliR [Pseudalkalibacillus hwajinpoensis]MCA0991152.1 flagellar type III secretion system protein FliR [Pseudalkalibacillus hwajinpoensis]